MEEFIKKIHALARYHDEVSPELVKAKDIKLGLRNADGTGVVVGITSKGIVFGFTEKTESRRQRRPLSSLHPGGSSIAGMTPSTLPGRSRPRAGSASKRWPTSCSPEYSRVSRILQTSPISWQEQGPSTRSSGASSRRKRRTRTRCSHCTRSYPT